MTTAEIVEETLTDSPSLAQLVRERLELSDHADPHDIVEELLADLDEDRLLEAARVALHRVAVAQCGAYRNLAMRPAPPAAAPGTSKWDRARDAISSHPEIFSARIIVGFVGDDRSQPIWRFLGDCSKADLTGAETIQRERGEALIRRADCYRNLARKLRAKQTVRDLPASKVEAIFNA